MIHIKEDLLVAEGNIDPDKIDLVGRLGGDYYVRTSGDAKFIVQKPLAESGIGVDNLPDSVRLSKFLTGNELGILGNLKKLPSKEEINDYKEQMGAEIKSLVEKDVLKKAKNLLHEGKPEEALLLLISVLTK
jgi:hypothetical protein